MSLKVTPGLVGPVDYGARPVSFPTNASTLAASKIPSSQTSSCATGAGAPGSVLASLHSVSGRILPSHNARGLPGNA